MPLGGSATEESVRSCMRRSLELAREKGCRTVAVPAIDPTLCDACGDYRTQLLSGDEMLLTSLELERRQNA